VKIDFSGILLTIPDTVASAERSFSKLKLVKNYLRSTMSQDRLVDLARLSIESEIELSCIFIS
jgi:20S proteasome alpha/beta subunit